MLPDFAPANNSLEWVGPLRLAWDEIDRIQPSIPGVYILHVFAVNRGGYPAFYVGQSRDIRRRLADHVDDGTSASMVRRIQRYGAAYFSAAPVVSKTQRLSVEAGLIRLLTPLCNRQVPLTDPIYTNLPPFTVFPVFGDDRA
jgi:hypothetical protein